MTLSKWNISLLTYLVQQVQLPKSQRMKMFESPLLQMGGRESGSDEAGSKDPWPLHRWFRPLLTRGINLARQGWRQEGEKGLKEIIGRFGKGKKEEGEELGRGRMPPEDEWSVGPKLTLTHCQRARLTYNWYQLCTVHYFPLPASGFSEAQCFAGVDAVQ